jgi:hypothetical protein
MEIQNGVVLNNIFSVEKNVEIKKGYVALSQLVLGNNPQVSSLDVRFLRETAYDFTVDNCRELTSLNVNDLTSVGANFSFNGNTAYIGLLNLANLIRVTESVNINNNTQLSDLDLTNLASSSYLGVTANPALTNITLTSAFLGTEIQMNDNALDQACVDAVLVALDTAGQLKGNLDLSGGTNATPSGTGLSAVASLQGKGWTVSHN